MSRRSLTLIIAAGCDRGRDRGRGPRSGALRDPSPGPTLNTLGKDPSGQPLISISGHPTYPTSGHLNMVTVSFQGGPGIG